MICCLGCNSGQQDQMSLPGIEICHLCHAFDRESTDETSVYARRYFEKCLDFDLGNERFLAHKNVTLKKGERSYFFYKLIKEKSPPAINENEKDMKSIQREAIANLDSFLTNQMTKRDPYRHAHVNISASHIRMHLSRIDSPLKIFNNDKGEMQLRNHAKLLSILGEKWVDKFIKDQYYIIDLTNAKGDSFEKRWYNSSGLKACDFHLIITRSTIIKLNKYLVDNQRFKIEKCTRQINEQITPIEECSEGWFVRVKVRELCHQLCSISFRTRSGSSYINDIKIIWHLVNCLNCLTGAYIQKNNLKSFKYQ